MNLPDDYADKAKKLTEQYFREDLNNCAESVFRSLMRASGRDCPVETLRLASAFGRGMGTAGCACGALVGGQMALGVFFGRESSSGSAPDLCAEAAKLLHKSFVKQNGAACCRILHKGLPYGTAEQFDSCCLRAINAAEIAAGVIEKMSRQKAEEEKS